MVLALHGDQFELLYNELFLIIYSILLVMIEVVYQTRWIKKFKNCTFYFYSHKQIHVDLSNPHWGWLSTLPPASLYYVLLLTSVKHLPQPVTAHISSSLVNFSELESWNTMHVWLFAVGSNEQATSLKSASRQLLH